MKIKKFFINIFRKISNHIFLDYRDIDSGEEFSEPIPFDKKVSVKFNNHTNIIQSVRFSRELKPDNICNHCHYDYEKTNRVCKALKCRTFFNKRIKQYFKKT